MPVWSSEVNYLDVHRDKIKYLKEMIFKKESYERKAACLCTWRSKNFHMNWDYIVFGWVICKEQSTWLKEKSGKSLMTIFWFYVLKNY